MKRLSYPASVWLLLLVAAAPGLAQNKNDALKLRSPNGRVEIAFSLNRDGAPAYAVSYDGRTMIVPSTLGLNFKQGGLLRDGMRVTATRRRTHDETYELIVGKTKRARDRYRELTVSLAETDAPRRTLQLIFRAYDDGMAFRYLVPRQAALTNFEMTDERSEFRFPADHECWAMQLRTFHSNYEKEFEKISLDRIKPGAKIGLPLVVQPSGGSATFAIAEADLKNYAGMYLQGMAGEPHTLVSRLSPFGAVEGESAVRGTTPLETPWRVLMIGDAPGRLIESTLILNLNEPNAIRDTSWIKPGKAAWDWWSGQIATGVSFKPGMNDATMKHYIDFAAEFKLEYMLVDAGWYAAKAYGDDADTKADITKSVPEIHLPELVAYARARGVGVMLWLHWITARDQMDKAFSYYEQLGIKGVKVDFMDHDDQEMVAFYQRILKTAAAHHLLVDLHGAYKPSGLARTYPNYLTQEGVLGAEYNKFVARITSAHNVTLPFTRMLVGPLDYTPGGFRNVTKEKFTAREREPQVMTTRAQQLAMYVVYDSPLQMVSDYPGAYRGQPGADFLRVVPSSWDETRVLAGRIGEYIVIARRRGESWFIGAMTNEAERTVVVPLDFLKRGAYQLTEYADGAQAATDPTQLSTGSRNVRAGAALSIRMSPSGGYAAHILPAK